jgi:hypothetical protein
MEPNNPSQPTPEQLPPPSHPESFEGPPQGPETVPAPTPERSQGTGDAANQNAGMPLPAVAPAPPATVPSTVSPPGEAAVDAPAVADDVDVIEKEWVDKAKQIVDKTKDDPYRQTEEVDVLKKDYRKKRFGRDSKASAGG